MKTCTYVTWYMLQITTVDPLELPHSDLGHKHSLYGSIHGIKVTVPASSHYGGTSSQPTSPMNDYGAHSFNKAMTPNSYQYGHHHGARGRPHAYSADWSFPNNNNNNFQPRETGQDMNINQNLAPMKRTNSNGSFPNHSTSFDTLMPTNVPSIPYASHHTSMNTMNTVNTVKIISDDSSSQHHVSGQFVEDDIDLPAMPGHNRANSLGSLVQTTPTVNNDNSSTNANSSEHVFDISRAPFGALFHDAPEKQTNQQDLPEIVDNTPVSTMKPNSQMASKETNSTNKSSSPQYSNHTENGIEMKEDVDGNMDGNIDVNIDENIVENIDGDKDGDEKNANFENNLEEMETKQENEMTINPNSTDAKENDDSDHQNKKDNIPPTNISPKQNKKSSPIPSGIQTTLNTMAGFNAINKQTPSSLSELQIRAKDPDAVPASPPIESVYKPVSQSGMMSHLSQISESNGLSSAGSSPMGYTPNDRNIIPETEAVNKSSNESFPDDNYQEDHEKDHIHDENNELVNVPPQIDTDLPLPDPNHLLPQKMRLLTEAVSSPSDVCI